MCDDRNSYSKRYINDHGATRQNLNIVLYMVIYIKSIDRIIEMILLNKQELMQ